MNANETLVWALTYSKWLAESESALLQAFVTEDTSFFGGSKVKDALRYHTTESSRRKAEREADRAVEIYKRKL